MPNYTATTTITTGKGDSLSASKSGAYTEVFNIKQELDATASFLNILTMGKSLAGQSLRDSKSIIIKNTGSVASEIQLKCNEWATNLAPETLTNVAYEHFLLNAGDYIYLPNLKNVTSVADSSGCRGSATVSNSAPSGTLYRDSGVNLGAKIEAADLTITVADLDYFKVGDLVQVGIDATTATRIEIMRVTAKEAESGSGTLTVDRALYGTSAADGDAQTDGTNGAVSGANVYFPHFNATKDYNKFSTLQTDEHGNLEISTMMGYGRTATQVVDGFSFMAGKFYTAGYQELGLEGISAGSKTGLAASTAYQFTIAVDGGSAYDLDVTTDASNDTFAQGANSLLSKIQDVFDAAYYTAGNLFEKRVRISLVGGDVRVSSGSHLSTSAIALGDSSGGDTDIWGAGRIPAVASVRGAVTAKLPNDTIIDPVTGIESPNSGAFFYDDGHGNIHGACSGSFDYSRGSLKLTGAPPNANFVLSWDYGGSLGGGNEFGGTLGNSIDAISARSVNSKINTSLEIIGLK